MTCPSVLKDLRMKALYELGQLDDPNGVFTYTAAHKRDIRKFGYALHENEKRLNRERR